MRTIKLTIAYDGTAYNGWQLQANGNTVQHELEGAIDKVFGGHHRLYGASRTDSGVHARAQVAHLKSASSIPEDRIPLALNALLPDDISVVKASYEKDDFHARFDAKKKTYRYHIFNALRKDPFLERYAWRVPYKLDIRLMRKESQVLLGRHDFKAFQASDKRERGSTRKIHSLEIDKKGSMITLDISGDGFLYNMVRNITGTLVDIGRGYFPEGSMKKILMSKDRTKAGPTAPAKGLFLLEVQY